MKKLVPNCGTVSPLLWAVKGTWGLVLAAAACFCVLANSASGSAPRTSVGSIRADDAQLAAKSRAAVLDLYSLDARLAGAQSRLSALETEATAIRRQRASIAHQLGQARLDTRVSQDRLAQRLRFIYDHGAASSLDVVMGASSLGDALTELDDFNRVAASNVDVLLQVRSAQRQLTQLRHELRSRQRTLVATTRAAAETVSELTSVRSARVDYIAGLADQRSLDAQRIASLEAQARAAVAKTETLAASAPTRTPLTAESATEAAPAPAAVVFSGRTLSVSATAYSLPGYTASGLPVGWGIVAVDPAVIPLGTHMMIPGYGEAVAADTGTAIIGARIDLWFPTFAQAAAWGRRTVTIALN